MDRLRLRLRPWGGGGPRFPGGGPAPLHRPGTAGRDPIVPPPPRCLRTGCHPVPPADGPSPADGHEGSRPGSCLWTPPPAVAAGAAVDDRARSTVPPCQYWECQDGARADTPLPEDEQHVGELAEKHTGCVAKIRGGRR